LIGVATGEVSGVDVFDIDREHPEAAEWWKGNRHRVPRTRVHRTKSGGLHLVFRHAPGLRCWAARPVVGIDGRGDGGYAIWWPAAGLPVLRDEQPTPWPAWLLDAVKPAPADLVSVQSAASWRPPAGLSGGEAQERYAAAALRSAIERVSRAGEGARNST